MKLAVLGIATAVVGLVIGVDGLILSGVFWFLTGLMAWSAIKRREESVAAGSAVAGEEEVEVGRIAGTRNRSTASKVVGLALLLLIGLGSLAIGLFEIGFPPDYESLRWLPIAVGVFVTVIALISIPVRFGAIDLEDVAEGATKTPGRVTIEASRATGTYINEMPRIEFDLLVEPEDRPAYRISKKATVPPTALGNIAVGDGFEARVGPREDSNIAIDWNAPLDGAGGDPGERLERLEDLRRRDLISPEEYDSQRSRILGSI